MSNQFLFLWRLREEVEQKWKTVINIPKTMQEIKNINTQRLTKH